MKKQIEYTNTINDLADINDARPLMEEDQPLVDEIYSVLKKYNAEKRFGLSLLHKHFDIENDEVLVESVDVELREQVVRPVRKQELVNLDYSETQWRLDTGVAMMACICVRSGNEHSHQSRG